MDVETNSVDLIVTSPPYANQRAATYGGVKPDDYVDWFLPVADQLHRVLKPSGTFILNIKEPAVNGERHTYMIELVLEMRKRGWLWTEEFAWHKKNCYPGKWRIQGGQRIWEEGRELAWPRYGIPYQRSSPCYRVWQSPTQRSIPLLVARVVYQLIHRPWRHSVGPVCRFWHGNLCGSEHGA